MRRVVLVVLVAMEGLVARVEKVRMEAWGVSEAPAVSGAMVPVGLTEAAEAMADWQPMEELEEWVIVVETAAVAVRVNRVAQVVQAKRAATAVREEMAATGAQERREEMAELVPQVVRVRMAVMEGMEAPGIMG